MKKVSFNDNWICRCAVTGFSAAVSLPHDAMLSEERTDKSRGGKNIGYFAGYDYTYSKTFTVPNDVAGKKLVFEFEGVYRNAVVTINGAEAARHDYGYTGFYVDATEYLNYDGDNEISVFVKNSDQPNSRWYTGTGIYRPVWLYILQEKHICVDGVRITTTSYEKPCFNVDVDASSSGEMRIDILDGERCIDSSVIKSDNTKFHAVFHTAGIELWSPESPKLYTCRVCFGDDTEEVTFGVRKIECDAQNGFRINGKRIILKGACIHHDNGLLGAVAHPFAEERKVRLLKNVGYNAIRSAHNPCSKALLDACDRLGMLVMDEYVDMWYIHKTKHDYADYFEKNWRNDLDSMVTKDYNHPSVVMYSIGNEVSETGQKKGIELSRAMTEYLHQLDYRPVTCGVNIFFNMLSSLGFGVFSEEKAAKSDELQVSTGKKEKAVGSEFFNNLTSLYGSWSMKAFALLPGCDAKTKDSFAQMDIAGYNYGLKRYKKDMRKYKDRVIVGSETFAFDALDFLKIAEKHPALIGDFVWTGIDHLGEVGLGAWEYQDYAPDFTIKPGWISSGAGAIDLTGRDTAEALYIRAIYGEDKIRIGVVRPDGDPNHSSAAWRFSNALDSWSFDGCEGKPVKVEVYSRCGSVKLIINGREIGTKKTNHEGVARFSTVYEYGEVVAIGYENGAETCRTSLKSAGKETKLTAVPENETISVDGLSYIRLRYTDNAGTVKPLVRGRIQVSVDGGELVALGHACPYNEDGYLKADTDTYYGEALAIVKPAGAGELALTAWSQYGTDTVRIKVE